MCMLDELYVGQYVTFVPANERKHIVARVVKPTCNADVIQLEYYAPWQATFLIGYVRPGALALANEDDKAQWALLKLGNMEL